MSAKKQKSIEQLEAELESIRAQEAALKEQIKEQARRIRVEEAQRKQDATTYLGMLLLKSFGLPWSQINYEKLSEVFADRTLAEDVWMPHQPDTRERLSDLKSFVKGMPTNDAPRADIGADNVSEAQEVLNDMAGVKL